MLSLKKEKLTLKDKNSIMFTRIKFIYGLVVISLLLLIFNISIEIFKSDVEKKIPSLTKNEIENKFAITLSQFAISNEWIKKVFLKKKLSDSLDYVFDVSIPQDISIAILIKEINKSFINSHAKIETNEKANYGNSVLQIYSNDILKLQTNLTYSDKVIRDYAEYSFLVQTYFGDENFSWDELNRIYYNFTYLVIPSQKSLEAINNFNKQYAILIDDQITDKDYLLQEDFSKQKLINNIHSILISFGKDKKYLIDESSEIYSSKIFSFIRDEFAKKGIELISLQKYPHIIGNSKEEIASLYNFYTTSLKGKEAKTFLIDFNYFLSLQPMVEKQLRMGDKIVEVKW